LLQKQDFEEKKVLDRLAHRLASSPLHGTRCVVMPTTLSWPVSPQPVFGGLTMGWALTGRVGPHGHP